MIRRFPFRETEFYPHFIDKAAVLVVRLTKNHPLPDGNKHAAWVALRLFVESNGWSWEPTPGIDDAERAMLAVAFLVKRGSQRPARPGLGTLACTPPSPALPQSDQTR